MSRVLIVQDSPPNARQLRLVRETQADQLRQDLEAEDFDVDVCLDASAAFAQFAAEPYDLAVVDLTVPGLSGFDLCRKMKATQKGAAVPILLVFTPTDPAHIVRALESGADSLIAVPFEREHLIARAQAMVHSHRSRAAELQNSNADAAAAHAEKARVLSFLLGTFDDLVRTHHELAKCQGELANAKQVAISFGHELERRVRERTGELMERQELLHQARKMDVLSEVTGGLAHDFNNILTVVVGNLDSLSAEMNGDPRHKKLADTALDAAMRGADLTRQLLAFSCKQPLAPRVNHINDVVTSMTQMLVRLLGDKVDIEVDAAEDLWPVIVDPAQFQNAIGSISRNAREAMPNGGKLKFRTRNVSLDDAYAETHLGVTPGEYCHLSIWDNGAGMSPKVLARVFEPLFTTKVGPKTSGFGLSSVFGFVKQSGGHVRIESQENTGTVVHIYLPRAKAEPHTVEAGGDASLAPPSGNETILLVEDDEQVRKTVAQQLHVLGYRVIEADRAGRALAALDRNDAIDLLFTDMILPGGIGGRELAREARAVRPNLRLLFTSGYLRGLRADHRLDPGDVFIGKPYRLRDLAEKVREALGQQLQRVAAQG